MSAGALRIPVSHVSGADAGEVVAAQNRSRAAGSSRTRKRHPWLKPAEGACSAIASNSSINGRATGRDGSYARTIRRLRTTSANSMPDIESHDDDHGAYCGAPAGVGV